MLPASNDLPPRPVRPAASVPSVEQLERVALRAERDGNRALCAACRRLVLERRVGPLPDPPRGDEAAGDVRDLSF